VIGLAPEAEALTTGRPATDLMPPEPKPPSLRLGGLSVSEKPIEDVVPANDEPFPQPSEPRQCHKLRLYDPKQSLNKQQTDCVRADDSDCTSDPMTRAGDRDGDEL
jgi:hypothetical protein